MKAWDRLSLRGRLAVLYAALLIVSVVLVGAWHYSQYLPVAPRQSR
jgi:hypothetical protein